MLKNKTKIVAVATKSISELIRHSLKKMPPTIPEKIAKVLPDDSQFSIGDIHGGFDQLVIILFGFGLIDHAGQWIGKGKRLVMMGDYVDRGEYSVECLTYLLALQAQAEAEGGEVILLLGNHELDYVQRKFEQLCTMKERLNVTKVQIQLLMTLIRRSILEQKLIAIWNNGQSFFVHGGIVPDLIDDLPLHESMLDPKNPETLNSLCKIINQSLFNSVTLDDYLDPIFWTGHCRDGHHRYGGIFWADAYQELFPASANQKRFFPQVVAHSAVKSFNGQFRQTERGIIAINNIINLDAGMCDDPNKFIALAFNDSQSFQISCFREPRSEASWNIHSIEDLHQFLKLKLGFGNSIKHQISDSFKRQTDPSSGWSPARLAADHGNPDPDLVKYLYYPELPSEDKLAIFHQACSKGWDDIVHTILKEFPDTKSQRSFLTAEDEFGWTSLMHASYFGSEIYLLLMQIMAENPKQF